MGAVASQRVNEITHKLGEVIDQTGVSKELIHHYLRLGIIPKPSARSQYSSAQIRLLHVVRKLREEHHLPLEDIRRLFEVFEWQPAELEVLVHADSLAKRLAAFARGGVLSSPSGLKAEEVAHQAGVSGARMAEYVALGIVAPTRVGNEDLFTAHDARVVSLCERGVELGVPFDSFRTIASYVQVAFELEHRDFFGLAVDDPRDATTLLRGLFVRREVLFAFMESLLGALESRALEEIRSRGLPKRQTLDNVIFRPSSNFNRRHRILEHLESTKKRLKKGGESKKHWHNAADLQLHAGFYREAAFLVEQALRYWPDDVALMGKFAVALLLSGELIKGKKILAQLVQKEGATATQRSYLALSRWASWPRNEKKGVPEAQAIVELAERALSEHRDNEAVHVRLICGWLLTAVPQAMPRRSYGRQVLLDTYAALCRGEHQVRDTPGMRERYILNAAFLVHEVVQRLGPPAQNGSKDGAPTLEDLRGRVCRLDPSSFFAEQVYLAGGEQ